MMHHINESLIVFSSFFLLCSKIHYFTLIEKKFKEEKSFKIRIFINVNST